MQSAQPYRYGLYPLTERDRPLLLAHLLNLDADSRRRRFGMAMKDAAIESIASDFPMGALTWGLFLSGVLKGTSMIVPCESASGEFAVTLDADVRGLGWGQLLLVSALDAAYVHGMEYVEINYLQENIPMDRLCRRLPGKRDNSFGDCTKLVDLSAYYQERHPPSEFFCEV